MSLHFLCLRVEIKLFCSLTFFSLFKLKNTTTVSKFFSAFIETTHRKSILKQFSKTLIEGLNIQQIHVLVWFFCAVNKYFKVLKV